MDLDRAPDGQALYAGANNTELCPTSTFAEEPIWLPGQANRRDRRTPRGNWKPYHDALGTELKRLGERHGLALLFDAHSIRSRVPRIFEGRLPDLNIGSAGGASAAPALIDAIMAIASAAKPYSAVLDGRFKGGYITRAYGRPQEGVHAIQLELAQLNYMLEEPPFDYRPDWLSNCSRCSGGCCRPCSTGPGGNRVSVLDESDQRIEADPVGQLRRALDFPDCEIRDLANLQCSTVRKPKRAGCMAGHSGQRLLGREPEQSGGHVQGKQRRGEGRGARIAVGRNGDRHARPSQIIDRRQLGLTKEVKGARQKHGGCASGGHCGDAGLRRVLEVIGGERVEACCQSCAAAVRELVRVQLYLEAEARCPFKQSRCFFGGEGNALGEGVHRVHQPFVGQGGKHLLDDPSHVIRAPAFELRRRGICAEERGANSHWPRFFNQPCNHKALRSSGKDNP